MPGNEFEQPDTRDGILERMRHHARPQALAEVGKYSKESPKYANDNHHSRSLVAMSETEDRGRDDDSNHGIPAKRRHALQIEVNRALYMDERTLTRNGHYATLKSDLTHLIAGLASFAGAAFSGRRTAALADGWHPRRGRLHSLRRP